MTYTVKPAGTFSCKSETFDEFNQAFRRAIELVQAQYGEAMVTANEPEGVRPLGVVSMDDQRTLSWREFQRAPAITEGDIRRNRVRGYRCAA